MAYNLHGRPRKGGGKIAMSSYSSTPVDVSSGRGFHIIATVDTWVLLSEDDTVIPSTDESGTLIAANTLYSFDIMGGFDKYLHIAGDGATGDAIVTVI